MTIEIVVSMIIVVGISALSLFLPRVYFNRGTSKHDKSEKIINNAIRSIFLLEALKVTNDDKSIDEVYENISKYKGAYKI